MTQASTASGEPVKEASAREPRTVGEEAVSEHALAADAGAEPTLEREIPTTSVETSSRFENDDVDVPAGQGKGSEHVGTGHGEMRTESGLKTNIPDKELEEMTARADGKGHAVEEEGSAE